jgi:hypothetical protein
MNRPQPDDLFAGLLAVLGAACLMMLSLTSCRTEPGPTVRLGPAEIMPPAAARAAAVVATQPRVMFLRWDGPCAVYTNTVKHFAVTNCPEPIKDHIELILSDRLVYFTNSSVGCRFVVWEADIEGSTNLVNWYPLGHLKQGEVLNRPIGRSEFYRKRNAT